MFLLTRTMVFNKITAFKLSVMSMETFLSVKSSYYGTF